MLTEPTTTGDSNRFFRAGWEVGESRRWVWVSRGGGYCRWDGLKTWLMDWEERGTRIKQNSRSYVRNERLMFTDGLTYTEAANGSLSVRILGQQESFAKSGPGIIPTHADAFALAAVLNSRITSYFLRTTGAVSSLAWEASLPCPFLLTFQVCRRMRAIVLKPRGSWYQRISPNAFLTRRDFT